MTTTLHRIFVYGTLLEGERDHALLAGAERAGEGYTAAAYHLVDLGHYAALVAGGALSVWGQIYLVSPEMRRVIDVARQVPLLFQRERIGLTDKEGAALPAVDAYVMSADQVRGKRRLHHGDWRKRFAPVGQRPLGASAWNRDRK